MQTELKDLIIDYDNYVEDIQHWVSQKSEYSYKELINFMVQNHITCDWKTITNYMKYDIRLQKNLFKYISFLERLYRSFVMKHNDEDISEKKILNLSFNDLLGKYIFLASKVDVEYPEIDIELLHKERSPINSLRNRVVHYKDIILHTKNYDGKPIDEILTIFTNILPNSHRHGYITDIQGCQKRLVENTWHIDYSESEQKFIIVSK